MLDIIINKEYEETVPRVSDEDFEKLKESIKDSGQWYPIIVNSSGVILDGHHRFRVCKQLGLKPQYVVKDFENELYEKLFVIDANLKRRHLNDFQRTEVALKAKPILEEIARERQIELGKSQGKDPYVKYFTKGRVDEEIGKRSEVSHVTVRKVEAIVNKATQELKDKVRKGQMSIEYAYKSITRSEDHKNTPALPVGEYDIILADPPWNYDINTRGSPDEHYAVMTNQEIEDLKVPSAENAMLFLWATAPKIREALDVMKSWGFKYKTNAVWIKQHFGTGYYFRGQHELLLVGEKGEMPVPEEHNRPSSVIQADRTQHSVKPTVVYLLIEKMYPNRKYLELFARSQFNQNWTVWGNEVQINAFIQ